MVLLHPTYTCDKKIVAEPVINIRYYLFPTTHAFDDEMQGISIAKPLGFIKKDPLSVGRPSGKISKRRGSIEGWIREDGALMLPRCGHQVDGFRGDAVFDVNEPFTNDLCAIRRPVR